MSKLPTLREFVDRVVQEFDGKERNLSDMPGLPPESRQRLDRRVLERRLGANLWVEVALPPIPDDMELLPQTLTALCKVLKLKPEDFGLTLH